MTKLNAELIETALRLGRTSFEFGLEAYGDFSDGDAYDSLEGVAPGVEETLGELEGFEEMEPEDADTLRNVFLASVLAGLSEWEKAYPRLFNFERSKFTRTSLGFPERAPKIFTP